MQNRSTVFIGAIILAIVCIALAVYYAVPGINHVLTFSGTPTDAHYTHMVGFLLLAAICIIGALVTRPKRV